MELWQRIVAHVEAGNTHHSGASRFDVSVKFVNDMVKLKRETGSLAPISRAKRKPFRCGMDDGIFMPQGLTNPQGKNKLAMPADEFTRALDLLFQGY